MTDTYDLKTYLAKNPDLIEKVLDECDFYNIHTQDKNIRCGWDYDSHSGNSILIDIETLYCKSFSKGIRGDIITLVQEKLKISFTDAINKICEIIGYKGKKKKQKTKEIFGGVFNNFNNKKKNENTEIKIYNEDILNKYLKIPNKRFIDDGIGILTQLEYEIMYDTISNRIIIVWRDTNGRIIGIVGRLNKDNISNEESKYLSLVPFKKSKALYGLNQNYKNILTSGTIVVSESEKSVMQMNTFGIKNAVSLGCCSISNCQKNTILSSSPKNIIIAFDEGLEQEKIVNEAEKLKTVNPFMDNTNIYYIYDKNGDILKKGSKHSPSDLGKDNFKNLIQNHLIKI